jgi:hypothetical protein
MSNVAKTILLSFNSDQLTRNFQPFGTPFEAPVVKFIVMNESNRGIFITDNQSNFRFPAGSIITIDEVTDLGTNVRGKALAQKNAQLRVRSDDGSGTGTIYIMAVLDE